MGISSLTQAELLELLTVAKAHRERDWLMLLVGYWHGLRASEITQIRARDVADGYLTVRRLKGSLKTRQALIDHPDPLLNERNALFDFSRKSKPNQRLFAISRVRLYQLMREYGKQAGIPRHKCHPHALKHSIAIHAIKDAGIHAVKQRLGHKSLSSTGAYLALSDAEADDLIAGALTPKALEKP